MGRVGDRVVLSLGAVFFYSLGLNFDSSDINIDCYEVQG